MILYSYLDAKGNYHSDFQFNGNDGKINYIRMIVPADKIKAGEFTRIDIANSKEKAQLYVNGTLADEKPLPPAFADAAARPHGWSEFMLLPAFPQGGDDFGTQAAVARLRVYPKMLTASEIAADAGKMQK